MDVYFSCNHCQAQHRIDPAYVSSEVQCAECSQHVNFNVSESIRSQNIVDLCPCCEKSSFYIQRDFNRNLGLAIVVLCALVGLFFVWIDRPLFFYLSLGAGVLLDFLLYLVLPDVTVCYACHTTFRKVSRNPGHKAFDLHIADHYEGRTMG